MRQTKKLKKRNLINNNNKQQMKTKIWKVTWLVWALLMLPIGQALAAVYSGTSGGTNWRLDTNTGELTISKSERGNGITGNYHHTWYYPSDGNSRKSGDYTGEAPWRTYQRYITSVVVEEDVVGIGAAAFAGLENLVSVSLPESLVSISYEAFRACRKLDSLHLGPNVCTLGDRWLTGTYSNNYYDDRYSPRGSKSTLDSMRVITIDPANPCFVVDKYGVVYTKDMKTLVKIPQHLLIDEIVIPEGVTKIATDALYQQQYLKSIVLPSTLTDVQYAAFDGIPTLEKIWFNSENAPEFEIGIGQSTNHDGTLIIYIPCDPDENLETRMTEYGEQTGLNLKNIQAFVNEYTIEAVVATNSVGKGTAQVTVRGVTCGDNTATIVATPYGGYHFLYWKRGSDGHEIGESTYTFTCTADETYTAYFSNNEYYLNVKAEDPAIATTTGSGRYEFETEVQISATGTKDCYHFLKWDDDNTDNPRTVVVDTTKLTYTAIFTKDQFIINGLTDPANGSLGTVSIVDVTGKNLSNGDKASCGDVLTFTATPAENCHFVNWNNNPALTNATIDTVVESNVSLKAFFAKDSFLVSFYNVNTLLCQKMYAIGETPACDKAETVVTLEYTYTFKGWSPEIVPVNGEATYYAIYDTTANPFKFITIVDSKETIQEYKYNEEVAAPADPEKKEGYVFNGWFDAPLEGAQISFPFNMPANDTVAYAVFTPDTFVLSYKTFDSTSVFATQKYGYGSDVTMLQGKDAPAREGYTFAGWSSTFQTMPARDTFVAAVYDINSYKLTLKDVDGSTISESTVEYGNQIDEPALDKEGYTCNGWLLNNQTVTFPFNMPAENVTLVANCEINTYVLAFKNDIDGEIIYKVEAKYGTPFDENDVDEPKKTGHTFDGWDHEIPTAIPAANDTFYAKWIVDSYEVTFMKDEDEIISSRIYEYGSKFEVPADPDSLGYTFQGWDPAIGDTITPADNVIFTAKWTVNQHTVTFKKNDDDIISSKEYNFGETFETPADPDSVGYTFKGWEPTVTSNKVPDEDLTFIAQWSINSYNYIVVKNNGEKNDTIVYDYNAEIKLPSTPEKEGYTFLGWSDSTDVMPAKNVVTEAQWSINQYNVTFMMNEKEVLSSQDYDFGSTFEVPSDPDSIGHKFLGWNPEIVSTVVPAESLVFVAQWSLNSYNYTIVKNNGEEDETTSYFYGEEFTLPSTPKKEGNTFLGWSDSTTVMPAKNVVTEAQWEVNAYTMTFMSGNEKKDTVISQQEVSFGDPIPYIQTPKKEGYTFNGWVNAEEGDSMRTIMPAKDLTYYATFKINSYVITFVDGNHDTIEVDGHRYCDTLEFGSKFLVPAFESIEAWNEQAFEGWTPAIEADTTVPARNITYSALYDGDKYPVYFIDGLTEKTIETIYYNSSSVVPEYTNIPEHEGYKFKEWHRTSYWGDAVKFPFTMVGQEESFYAFYDPIYYKVAILDGVTGDTIAKDSLPYGNELCDGRGGRDYCIYPESFEKEGYKFLGLSDTVLTVPAHDLTIIALYGINSYDVTYVNTYTGEKDTVSYKYGDIVKAIEYEPSECVDYTVWINEEGDTIQFGFAMPAHNTVAYLDFDIKSFTLTFKDYNDTVLFSNVLEGESILIENERERWQSKYKSDNDPEIDLVPHREGYRFIGWTSEEDGVTTPAMVDTLFRDKEMPCHDLEYIANYVIDTFNVYLVKEFNEGKPLYYDTIPYVFNAEVTEPAHDSITGYHYNGWYSYPSYENVTFSFVMPAHDTIICLSQYSPNQYELTFKDYNDTTLRSTTVEYGTPVATADSISYAALVPVPSREGYTFTGWDDEIPATMPDADVVLTAQYSINSYPITFYFDEDSILYTDTIEYQSAISVPNVEREGYKFTGWGATIPGKMPADTLEFYAQFEAIPYTLTFVDFDRTEISKTKYTFGDYVSYPKEDPTRVGYTFTGWSDSLTTMPAKNVTSQAKYDINQYTVTFLDSEENVISSITDNYGKVITAPNAPAVKGHKFIGWDKEVPTTIPDSNVVLTAQYSVNEYIITFLNHDSKELGKDTIEYEAAITDVPVVPYRIGYEFIGWLDTVPAYMPDHDVTCKAQFSLKQYELRFLRHDSVLYKGMKGNYGGAVTAPAGPAREGYTFTGWDKEVPATFPDSNMTFVAQYDKTPYTISFFGYNDSLLKQETLYMGDAIEYPEVPEVEGYKFAGWSDTLEVMPTKDVKISVRYTVGSYTITYNDYNNQLIESHTINFRSKVPTIAEPKRDGYHFVGWDVEIPEYMPAKNIVAVAEYEINKHLLTFKDYDKSDIKKDSVEFKSTIERPEDPVREGYTFTGWSDKDSIVTMPDKSVTITAKYSVNTYVMSFRTDAGEKISSKSYAFGAKVTEPSIPEREGYTIIGWDKEVPTTMPAHDDTVIALYQINKYYVAFKDVDTVYFADSLVYGEEIPEIADPTKEGYTFTGWDVDLDNVPAVNIVVFATWKANPYSIAFVDYDETVIFSDTLDFGAAVTAPADPTREGYDFAGWKPEVPETMPAYDDTLYAQYTVKKYEIIFKDGDVIYFKDSLSYGDPMPDVEDPTKEGYTFEGWDPELPETVPAEDMIITPKWSKSDFIITFFDFDSTEIFKDTLSYQAKIVTPKDPKREGYTFTAWDPTVPSKMPGNDFSCYAQYTINKHLVVFEDGDGNEIYRDSLVYGDPMPDVDAPEKEGYTFDGWDPELPNTVPDNDLYIKPTYSEDSIIIKSIDAFADNFCAGDEARIYYTCTSGKPLTFKITFDEKAEAAGFETQFGSVGDSGEVFMKIPAGIEEGKYHASIQFMGETQVSEPADFTFSTNISSRYLTRMWDDVIVCDNSNSEFEKYQWYKDGKKIVGATKQFYCELGGLNGFYSLVVTTKDGKKKTVCGIQCDYVLPPFSIIAYPNPAKANEEFTLEVKGLTEEELNIAKIYVYSVSGILAHTERQIEYKNLVSLPQGEYIALVVVDGKSAYCKILVR